MQTSQAEFAACIRDRFQVCPDEGSKAVAFQLAEVKECGSDGSRECFSLLFQGPAFPLLPQKLYRFQHERLGTAHLFVVPIEEVREGIQYEVIFNRRICLDAFPEIRTGPSADRKGDCDRTVYRGNSHVWRKLCAAGLGVLQRSAARRRPKQSSVFRVGPDLRRRRANDFCASRFAGTGTDASGSRTGTYPRSIGVTRR